ncbi:hypothetical protein PV10_03341 [Exophiala mesophila]|uniref:Uncharacterized protein n=1 Tax=Exophiala mesophila TaxID=212818 RepID=A0A0D1ZM40_EXOME|nr:uncharacterized protein PV10_03341 [Exophiala mesophila]KIV95722.1 hypothetical protein PV10_03341 [Exophiala mesophila]
MVDVFAERIYPQVPIGDLIRAYLRHNSWDFESAVSQYTEDRERLLESLIEEEEKKKKKENETESSAVSSISSSSSSSSSSTKSSGVSDTSERQRDIPKIKELEMPWWLNDNNEQERRDAGLALRIHYEDQADDEEVEVTPSEAILLLHMADWDFTEACEQFRSLPDAIRAVGKQFDRMRSSLPPQTLKPRAGDEIQEQQLREQDERLATFINITGRSDWFSLKVFLEKRHWNLIAAIEAWFRSGVPPVLSRRKHVLYDLRYDYNMKTLPPPSGQDWEPQADGNGEDGWALDRDTDVEVLETTSSDDGDETSDDESESDTEPEADFERPKSSVSKTQKPTATSNRRPEGFTLHLMKGTAKPGLRSDWRFLHEYISRGRYWANRFKAYEKFEWPALGTHDHHRRKPSQTRVPFDWNNQEHIHLLNNFRRQNNCRTTNTSLREAAQLWSEEEKEFLLQLNLEWLATMRQQFPDLPEDDLMKKPICNQTKKDWQTRLNAKFQGTIQQGSTTPRRERSIVAIISQRTRTPAIIERFKLKADAEYFRKRANRIAKEKSKEQNALKRSLEGDQEDDGQPAEKRARIGGSMIQGYTRDDNDDEEIDVEGDEVGSDEEETEEVNEAVQ